MYLKSLEVQGFKSFANKLVFEFHDGITAIVGPNGSGKSNVADAVRWVLGEQSARQLRGAKMEDVIFSGTELRRPLGYAYVAINISNEDHKLSVPYEEVKIARRVYRSGESEYLMNGSPCRLRDVQELLFDTGIGKEGYSIIGQGQIDKILSGKPEERRELFDEAAGIVKYKKRKAAAEKNLEDERQSLVRVEDILAELEKQVGPLYEQSEKARKYLFFRDELKKLDVNMYLNEYGRIQGEMSELDRKKDIADGDYNKAKDDFERSKKEYEESAFKLEGLEKLLEEEREKLSTDKVKLTTYESDIRVLNEQIKAVRQSEETYNTQCEMNRQKRSVLLDEKSDFGEQREGFDSRIKELERKQSGIKEKMSDIDSRIADAEEELLSSQDAMLSEMQKSSEVKADEQHYKTLIEQNKLKRAEVAQRILKQKTEYSKYEQHLERENKLLLELSEKIADAVELDKEITKDLEEVDKNIANYEAEHGKKQQQFHIDNSRLSTLKNMAERYEGFGHSTKRVMEKRAENPGIIGVVADIINVDKEYEVAVEVALGGNIRNVVTEDEATAKKMIEYLKKNKYGRVTFLPLTNVKGKRAVNAVNIMSEHGVIGLASTLVKTDEKFSGLLEYLLGRFVVVDNIDNALLLAAKYHHTLRIVTMEGELLNPGGSISGGAFKGKGNLIGRRREQELLEDSVKGLKNDLDKLTGLVKELEGKKSGLAQKLSENNGILHDLSIKRNTAKLNYDRAKSDKDKSEKELERIMFESSELERSDGEIKGEMARVDEKLEAHGKSAKDYKTRMDELNLIIENLNLKKSEFTDADSNLMIELTTLTKNLQFASENENRVDCEIEKLDKELAEIEENSRTVDSRIADKQGQIIDVREKLNNTSKEISRRTEFINEKESERAMISGKHKVLIGNREELSDKISALDKECFRLSNQREKLMESITSYTNYMWEEYELTYHAAEELKTEATLTDAEMKREISKYKRQMKELGDVNVNAVEQYKETNERYELLKSQHDDLIDAKKALEDIIDELDVQMRKQFEEQFSEIEKRFNKVFKELFGGGHGTITLSEDEDILLAGIRIEAQPPGKKLQNMMQLSGGEKALTAIALLFAIQSLKPSPFCLLDEIEAALDDSNVGRYADYLHKLTKDTQFIVITHRRGTMNAADILYGITMQEKGVSTLVSVSLIDEALEEDVKNKKMA